MSDTMPDKNSPLWQYFSKEQQALARDGEFLLQDRKDHPHTALSDYSYLVFPFSKLYEGFLKQLFLDLNIISDIDYRSDHYRIGKALSPNLVRRLGGRSAYGQIEKKYGKELAGRLWHAWKQGRNLIFHFFPHNYRALNESEARDRIALLVQAMEKAVSQTHVLQSQT